MLISCMVTIKCFSLREINKKDMRFFITSTLSIQVINHIPFLGGGGGEGVGV